MEHTEPFKYSLPYRLPLTGLGKISLVKVTLNCSHQITRVVILNNSTVGFSFWCLVIQLPLSTRHKKSLLPITTHFFHVFTIMKLKYQGSPSFLIESRYPVPHTIIPTVEKWTQTHLLWPWGLMPGSGTNSKQGRQTDQNTYLALAELTNQRIPAKEN